MVLINAGCPYTWMQHMVDNSSPEQVNLVRRLQPVLLRKEGEKKMALDQKHNAVRVHCCERPVLGQPH